MLSIPDMAILGAAALLLFGPEQLPKVLRKVGQFTREVQNTSQSFIREMERAAEVDEAPKAAAEPYPSSFDPPPYDAAAPFEPAETYEPHAETYEPPEPEPSAPASEKLAEPRGALEPWDQPTQAMPAVDPSRPAKAAPEDDHPVHI